MDDTNKLNPRRPQHQNGHATNSSDGFFGSPATTSTEYRLREAGLDRMRSLNHVDMLLAIEGLKEAAHSNLRPDIACQLSQVDNDETIENGTLSKTEWKRFSCLTSTNDIAAAAQALGHASYTMGRRDLVVRFAEAVSDAQSDPIDLATYFRTASRAATLSGRPDLAQKADVLAIRCLFRTTLELQQTP